MATDDVTFVLRPIPADLSGVRDQGVQALISLAVSLDWRAHQKQGQPVVLTSDWDGYQRRLPTNTSIRISVFQTTLSSIITHTEPNLIPTIDLIDEIIAQTKPSGDHQRRLRLAVGESPKQHRQRVENSVTPEHRPDPRQEHLMQHIEVPEEETATEVAVEPDEWSGPPPFTPVDGEDHGELLSREPLMARRSSGSSVTQRYQSDTNYERHWADGFVDFECQICGHTHTSSRGIGAHSQVHDRPDKKSIPAWKRSPVFERVEEIEPIVEWEEPDPSATATVPVAPETVPVVLAEEPSTTEQTLAEIIRLVVPSIVRERDRLRAEVAQLREVNQQLEADYEGLRRDWQALKELIGGR
jgi:hypothetical protein